MIENLASYIVDAVPATAPDEDATPELKQLGTRALTLAIQERFGKPVLPTEGETVAIALRQRKVAALIYDRIWSAPLLPDPPPGEIVVYGATAFEIFLSVLALVPEIVRNKVNIDLSNLLSNLEQPEEGGMSTLNHHSNPQHTSAAPEEEFTRGLGAALHQGHGVVATTFYGSSHERDMAYAPGDRGAILAVIRQGRG